MIQIFTIGFTKKTAEQFFVILKENGVKKVVDIRLNNKSQLAGFAKGRDLEYFLKTICGIEYVYRPEFAPTEELLDSYQAKTIVWREYEAAFNKILTGRDLKILPGDFKDACLLCSEPAADKCHRRLTAEYLAARLGNARIIHL